MRRYRMLALVAALSLGSVACTETASTPRPNFVLFVLDTTRADAVSAHGVHAATTPTLDALANTGLRYARAYSQAPWTLPSHLSIFTGLLPSEHGTGWRETRARDELVTLAERLRDAGYQTFGVSENPWISTDFNLDQGFEKLLSVRRPGTPETLDSIRRWLERREPGPFFLFVNVVDPHAPYTPHLDRLPDGAARANAQPVSQDPGDYNCGDDPMTAQLDVLHAFYHGDVAAADAKLAAVLQALEESGEGENTIIIVVSDHGEHFGENRLVSHQFSVRNPLLHVPLVVHGLPGVEPAVIEQPVALVDLLPSMLAWAGEDLPAQLPGQPLPTASAMPDEPRDVVAEYADPGGLSLGSDQARSMLSNLDDMRRLCGDDDRVRGSMRSLIRYPFKLIEYQHYPAELYDLQRDPYEENDLASQQADRVAELTARLGPLPNLTPVASEVAVDPETLDALEALGYVGASGSAASPD